MGKNYRGTYAEQSYCNRQQDPFPRHRYKIADSSGSLCLGYPTTAFPVDYAIGFVFFLQNFQQKHRKTWLPNRKKAAAKLSFCGSPVIFRLSQGSTRARGGRQTAPFRSHRADIWDREAAARNRARGTREAIARPESLRTQIIFGRSGRPRRAACLRARSFRACRRGKASAPCRRPGRSPA